MADPNVDQLEDDAAVAAAAAETKRSDDLDATAAATTLAHVAAAAAQAAQSASASPSTSNGNTPDGSTVAFDPAAPNAVNGLPSPLPANYDKVRVNTVSIDSVKLTDSPLPCRRNRSVPIVPHR